MLCGRVAAAGVPGEQQREIGASSPHAPPRVVFAGLILSWCVHLQQDAALTSLKVSAQLCGELLAECHSAPPEALLTAAMQLHDHALLVGCVVFKGGVLSARVCMSACECVCKVWSDTARQQARRMQLLNVVKLTCEV